jgi:hypothetical protein
MIDLRTTMIAIGLAVAAGPAFGLCTDGRHPQWREEFADSDIVATGTAAEVRRKPDDKDPDGYIATIYEIRTREIFRGRIPKRLHVESENTSSRFPMQPGVTYLLFLKRDASSGHYFIDNCGNSAPLDQARPILSALSKMRARPVR